jgi:predicted glycogen debranching enzyme
LQWFAGWKNDPKAIKPAWWKAVKDVINAYSIGTSIVKMHPDGLLYADGRGKPLSWMNAIVAGKAVNPRTGYAVEINALWYNALCFALELASEFGDKGFIEKYQGLAARIPQSFDEMFWNDKKAYLADFADDTYKDWSVRPNQLLAASLPYSPLAEEKRKKVVDIISGELLTDRGIRTLSPKNPNYHGSYTGDQQSRDLAYHNGCAFPWFMGSYADAYMKLYAKSGLSFIKGIYANFEGAIGEHGIGSISELYDGDPPHHPGGSISHAISVAEIIRMRELIKQYDDK